MHFSKALTHLPPSVLNHVISVRNVNSFKLKPYKNNSTQYQLQTLLLDTRFLGTQ